MDERDYVVIDIDPAMMEAIRVPPGTRAAEELPDLGVARGSMDEEEIHDLRRKPGRYVAERMPLKLIEPFDAPEADTSASLAWGVEAVGADVSSRRGEGITVAVLDTGIEASHPAFDGVKVIEKDFTGSGDGDTNGHGT